MPPIYVDSSRLIQMLDTLRQIGRTDDGGVHRVAYTQADVEGRARVMEWMTDAGLEIRVDAAGNIFGRRDGIDPSLPPITAGSHTDTVPNGGAFDGSLGTLAALECVWTFADRDLVMRHPLEVVVFQNEEGGLYGSAAMARRLADGDLNRPTLSGKTLREGIEFIGGDPGRIDDARREPGELAAYLELHIEQGAVLEDRGIQIGVVEGIFGIEQWDVTVCGAANHAGTTPMAERKDALLAAADFIRAVNDIVRGAEGAQVGTVGQIDARPGAPNVIAGEVHLCVELRDLDTSRIHEFFAQISERSRAIAKATHTTIEFSSRDLGVLPAPTDAAPRSAIVDAADALDLSHITMPSGAGHDAQNLAPIAPIGMIFVPSVGGVSHSPEEYSRPEDVVNGANVLLNAVLVLDGELN